MAARAVPLALLATVATTSAWCLTATPGPARARAHVRARALGAGAGSHLGRPQRRHTHGRAGALTLRRRAMTDVATDAEVTDATTTVAAEVVVGAGADSEETFYEAEMEQVCGAGGAGGGRGGARGGGTGLVMVG